MATLNENITRLEAAKASIKTSIEAKGVTVGDGLIDTYSAKIDQIPQETTPLDLTGTGWEIEPVFPVSVARVSTLNEDIEYTRTKYAEWDPSKTSLFTKYYDDEKLAYAPKIDTSKVTNMTMCFRGCRNLTSIPMLDTSNVIGMNGCFTNCSSLTTIPQLDTSKVTNMSSCFSDCTNLTSVELTGGMLPECNCTDAFANVTTTGVLKVHTGGTVTRDSYQPIIAVLPSTWTVQEINDLA